MFHSILQIIEKYLWIPFLLSLVIGIFLPSFGIIFAPYIVYMLMFMLFLSFLKIDIFDIIHHFKKPLLLLYITIMILIIIPAFLFFLTKLLYPSLAISILLICVMPAGMSTPALTDLNKGDTAFALVITTITSFIAPLTIPFMMLFFTGQYVSVSAYSMFLLLVQIIGIPFVIALIARKFCTKWIQRTKQYYGSVTIVLISLIVIGVLAGQATYILEHWQNVVSIVLYLFFMSLLLHILGWFMVIKANKSKKIAFTLSNASMNVALAMVIATHFFASTEILTAVLYQIPWIFMLIPFQYFVKRYTTSIL